MKDKIFELEAKLGSASDELKSHSPQMEEVVNLAREVAKTDATVLLTGESGTGKSVFARMIHALSARSRDPFATVSCPALSAEILESELFGHVKGAFTGAIRHHPGRIAATEGGTLFLDEIGDLPLALQPKLLRFLQDYEFESVGDTITKKANVRIVAATNVNLYEAVKAQKFREDLFYRINVINIEIPPLRKRPEDIILLAQKFLLKFRKDKRIVGFTNECADLLSQYQWPGNVRELQNVVERAVIMCHDEKIQVKDIKFGSSELQARELQIGDLVTLEYLEEKHIRRVLASTKTIEETARVLGIDAATLWRRRKRYGI